MFSNYFRIAVFFISILFLSPSWSSLANRLDDKQVKIIFWPEVESRRSVQIDFESSSIQEKVNSSIDGTEVTVNELPTYAISMGAGLFKDLRGGIQFGPTRIIFLNFSLNFNLQYDLYKNKTFLVALVAMYGGVIFPGERYGGKALLSMAKNNSIYYFSAERIKSSRYFQFAFRDENAFRLHNKLEYSLINDLFIVGVRSYKIGELLGNKNTALDLSIGVSNDVDLKYYNAHYEPANFHRVNGYILSASWIILY